MLKVLPKRKADLSLDDAIVRPGTNIFRSLWLMPNMSLGGWAF